jgi:hypothetical protein
MGKIVVLKDVIALPYDVFEPGTYEGRSSYTCKFLLPKGSDVAKLVKATMLEEANNVWKNKGQQKLNSFTGKTENCLRDGDLQDWEPLHDHYVLSAKARATPQNKPLLVDRVKGADGKLKILTPADGKMYKGVRVNAKVELWGQDKNNPGMRCSLLVVQFKEHSPEFSGGTTPSVEGMDDLSFEEDTDENFDDFEV